MKKIAAMTAAVATLVAVTGFAASAIGAAPVKDEFLTIGGPKNLAPTAVLRVPIRCSVECSTKTKTRLQLFHTDIPPSHATGHLLAGKSRNLVVTLNDAATETIQTEPGTSKLRVAVTATSDASGNTAKAVKVFGFAQP